MFLLEKRSKDSSSVGLVVFLIFFTSYMWATNLKIADFLFRSELYNWWSNFQKDSDSFIIARLNSNNIEGLTSHFGAIGPSGNYEAQIGFGGWLLSVVPTLLPLSENQAIWLMYTITAALNSVVATALCVFLLHKLGKYSAIAFGLCLIQPWPTAIFHSIYWSLWIKLLPFIFVFLWLSNSSRVTSKKSFLGLFLVGMFTFSSGYEFTTLVFFSVVATLVYFSFLSSEPLNASFIKNTKILSVFMLSFAGTLFLHYLQLFFNLHSSKDAFVSIITTVAKRTGFTSLEVDPMFLESLRIQPLNVLQIYMDMPVFLSPHNSVFTGGFSVQALILIVFVGCWSHIMNRQHSSFDFKFDSLFAFWLVGLLGPISWYLLARPHSFIHQHINFALWYVFSIPLGAALIVHLFERKRPEALKPQKFEKRHTEIVTLQKFKVVFVLFLSVFVVSFAYSFLSVR